MKIEELNERMDELKRSHELVGLLVTPTTGATGKQYSNIKLSFKLQYIIERLFKKSRVIS